MANVKRARADRNVEEVAADRIYRSSKVVHEHRVTIDLELGDSVLLLKTMLRDAPDDALLCEVFNLSGQGGQTTDELTLGFAHRKVMAK